MTLGVPFAERGGALRGLVDLATGCYPPFLFGGAVGEMLPVFHFHDETREWLEPRLQYLVDNGYRTVTCDEIERLVVNGASPGPNAVALTFDDAWASAWRVATPLLKKFQLKAILFAIPGRIQDDDEPFVSWAELREMQASGVWDIQSHTRSHAMIFEDSEIIGFVTPEYRQAPLLERPLVDTTFLPADALGTPLYRQRSRMSDARRYLPDEKRAERCRDHVASNGGERFFDRSTWRQELHQIAEAGDGASERFETDHARAAAIREELAEGRALLNERLATNTVRHVALPWGIAGEAALRALAETGHRLAFAERPLKRRGVRAGDDRHGLMRLNGKFLTCLPGRGRKWFFTTV
jgi:polysaccharide deacetylase